MLQARFIKNLIIDGHGQELTGQTFDFRRPQGHECDLYCYIFQGLEIRISQSNAIIRNAALGNISREIANTQLPSRIGGTPVTDKKLFAIQYDDAGNPQWNIDNLFTGGDITRNIVIDGVNLVEIVNGNNTYIRLPFGSQQSIKLSQIINHYNNAQYNILWCVCRVE
jgi:hypothetical protein